MNNDDQICSYEDDYYDNADYIQILVIIKKAGEVEEYVFIMTTIFFLLSDLTTLC